MKSKSLLLVSALALLPLTSMGANAPKASNALNPNWDHTPSTTQGSPTSTAPKSSGANSAPGVANYQKKSSPASNSPTPSSLGSPSFRDFADGKGPGAIAKPESAASGRYPTSSAPQTSGANSAPGQTLPPVPNKSREAPSASDGAGGKGGTAGPGLVAPNFNKN
jgi:hypothetical protein